MEVNKLLVLVLALLIIKGDVCRPDTVGIYLDDDYSFYSNPSIEIKDNRVYLGFFSSEDGTNDEYPTIVQYDIETEIICVYTNEWLSNDLLKAGTNYLFGAGLGFSKLPIDLCDETAPDAV